jgi:hypothetical protein
MRNIDHPTPKVHHIREEGKKICPKPNCVTGNTKFSAFQEPAEIKSDAENPYRVYFFL